jgi:hypothetical protein
MPPHYEANAPSPMLNNAYLKKGTNQIKKKASKKRGSKKQRLEEW